MDFLRGLAVVLLSMVGYSTGAMIGGGKKRVTPSLADIITLVTMWVTALMTQAWIGNKWLTLCLWIIFGLLMGIMMVVFQRKTYPTDKNWMKTPTTLHGFKRFWEGWKAFGKRMGNYQSRIMLGLFYFPVVIPFGILVRVFQDPFLEKRKQSTSRWVARTESTHDMESIRRQF